MEGSTGILESLGCLELVVLPRRPSSMTRTVFTRTGNPSKDLRTWENSGGDSSFSVWSRSALVSHEELTEKETVYVNVSFKV